MSEEEVQGGITKFLPAIVVIGALAGFISLASYAYHAGKESVSDEGVLVIEAEKTPMKEKPLDPGGMQFPNQDKTVFETFAAGGKQAPKVERVLPTPEEPMQKQPEADVVAVAPQAVHTANITPVTEAEAPIATPAPVQTITEAPATAVKEPVAATEAPAALVEAKPAAPVVLEKTEAAPVEPVKSVIVSEKPAEKAAQKTATKPAEKSPAKTASGKAQVQLGAFKSEAEAKTEWVKLQKKFPALAGKTAKIIKADLGAKGVFYRLRAVGFGSAADAKSFCSSASAKGQACILPAS
jgi:hypothetical protein